MRVASPSNSISPDYFSLREERCIPPRLDYRKIWLLMTAPKFSILLDQWQTPMKGRTKRLGRIDDRSFYRR
ncbi:hypothetical protein BT96DRAFT_336886 [Gymnopus androsaceus JB14]|uniref:Uncharacterized protein n=1 Tax=Gymnopus androsaceus JB14 TaxID=1447944 RepID=A0A6A4I4D4_9AGAR|nr:hypothetical protein BT96DRAFT_336886 [Gymnopus androsaceus JB14]